MSTDNDYGTTSTVKNKKRMPTWLVILLILVLFAGGVLAGLWFQKVPARCLHIALGALILLGGVRLLLC